MFTTLQSLALVNPFPGFTAKLFHSTTMTIASWSVEKGAILPEHDHPHEQITIVLEGEMELTIGSETQIVREGGLAAIPSNVRHAGRALTACRILDVFHPVRADYK